MGAAEGDRKELIEELVQEVCQELGIGGVQIVGWSAPGLLKRSARLVICQMGRDRILHFPNKLLGSVTHVDGRPAREALIETIRNQLGSTR